MFKISQASSGSFPNRDPDRELSDAVLRLAVVTWPEHAAGIVADWLTESCYDALADKSRKAHAAEVA
ncbi:MAG: hypothetical protein MPJ50_14390 [Pirellulales bacterium]|nr:hypothetical protein [Pirellulales bacterium]